MKQYVIELNRLCVTERFLLKHPVPVTIYEDKGEFLASGATVRSYGRSEEEVLHRFQSDLVSVYADLRRSMKNKPNKRERRRKPGTFGKKGIMRYRILESYLIRSEDACLETATSITA